MNQINGNGTPAGIKPEQLNASLVVADGKNGDNVEETNENQGVALTNASQTAEFAELAKHNAAITELGQHINQPSPTTDSLDTDALSGAISLAYQLTDIGPGVQSSDALMAQFLKLAVLNGTSEDLMNMLANQGHSTLLLGAINQTRALFKEAAGFRSDQQNANQKANQLDSQADKLRQQNATNNDSNGGNSGTQNTNSQRANQLQTQSLALRLQGVLDGMMANSLESQGRSSEELEAIISSSIQNLDAQSSTTSSTTDAFNTALNPGPDGREELRNTQTKQQDEYRNAVAALLIAMAEKNVDARQSANNSPLI